MNAKLYKNMTQMLMVLAETYCKLWHYFRCGLRNKSDFNYFVKNLRDQYPLGELGDHAMFGLPFFQKVVLEDNEFERSCAVKIGQVSIEYSFDKTQKEPKILLLDDSPRWEIARALLRMTIQQNHNATVLKFSKQHRKDKEDGSKYINRKSSS